MTDHPNKGGRPRKEIDITELINLAAIACTAEECAAHFAMSPDTLDLRLKDAGYTGFTEFYKEHSARGVVSIRSAQFKLATQELNPTMLIWLGKQRLGQQDRQTTEHVGTVKAEVTSDAAFTAIASLLGGVVPATQSGTDSPDKMDTDSPA